MNPLSIVGLVSAGISAAKGGVGLVRDVRRARSARRSGDEPARRDVPRSALLEATGLDLIAYDVATDPPAFLEFHDREGFERRYSLGEADDLDLRIFGICEAERDGFPVELTILVGDRSANYSLEDR